MQGRRTAFKEEQHTILRSEEVEEASGRRSMKRGLVVHPKGEHNERNDYMRKKYKSRLEASPRAQDGKRKGACS